jgi:hypothetical protein
MNFADADPKATRSPIVQGSASMRNAKVEAINRFDGPANGIMFRKNEVKTIPNSSNSVANHFSPYSHV